MRKCHFHYFRKALNQCQICENLLCKKCNNSFDSLNFCPTHANLYKQKKWIPIQKAVATSDCSDDAVKLYELKDNLWRKESIPSFLTTVYEINEEKDLIESHITLYCTEGDIKYFKI
ncbi:MAG: hypothetical protein ACO20H_00770 [Bacteriovoracaceae bacterium]